MKFAYIIEPPFNIRLDDGTLTGCDIELARHVLHAIGVVDIEFVETEFAELLPGLANGTWDMTTGMFPTDQRRTVADFTRSIWAIPDGLLLQQDDAERIKGYRCVAKDQHATLAVLRDQVQHQTAIQCGVPDSRIRVFETYLDATQAVAEGTATAYASVARAHQAYVDETQALTYNVVPFEEKAPAVGAFAVRNGDPRLVDLNAALDAYMGTSGHRAAMRHFGFSDADIDLILD